MKLLSVAVPCYNSEAYMRKCIDSLLVGGEDVEISLWMTGQPKTRLPGSRMNTRKSIRGSSKRSTRKTKATAAR